MRRNTLLPLIMVLLSITATTGQPPPQLLVKQLSDAAPGGRNKQMPVVPETSKILNPAADPGDRIVLLTFPQQADLQKVLRAYERAGSFVYAEPNFIGSGASEELFLPNDEYFNRQWYLINDGHFGTKARPDADIDMEMAWGITRGSEKVTVAILDTGIKPDHPEFAGRLWQNTSEVSGNGIDDDKNGYIDDLYGWDFVNGDADPTDDNGHGTHISAIIGANGDNGIGYSGMDLRCKLMICKVLGKDLTGFYSDWIAGIYYAVDNGANVINLSLGGRDFSRALREAIDYACQKNVVVVASMQNQNTDTVYYPAGYEATIAVGATDPDDRRSTSFLGGSGGSNYGQHLDVVAPGNYIYGPSHQSDIDYSPLRGGTSASAPMVSGLVSLLLARQHNRDVKEIINLLFTTAEDVIGDPAEDTPGWDPYYGYGRINAYAALSATNNTSLRDSLVIFPNPATDEITIALKQTRARSLSVELIDSHGQFLDTVFQSPLVRSAEVTLHLPLLAPGVYYLLFKIPGHSKVERLLIIR